MTIRIPNAVLIGFGVAAVIGVVVAAFLLGRSSSGDDEGSANGSGEVITAETAECSKTAFEEAIIGTEIEEIARSFYSPPGQLIDPPTGWGIKPLECADLDGDGLEEMVGGLATGASYQSSVYGIFRDEAGSWELTFTRGGFVVGDLNPGRAGLVEEVATYGVGDARCCPSGIRENRIIADGDSYRVQLGGVSDDRGIQVTDETGVTRIGSLDADFAGPSQATAALGAPTSAFALETEVCNYDWTDLGLSISFVNLGGGEACASGAIQEFSVQGLPAEQAGWQTADGVRVGMNQRQLSRLYPFVDDQPATSNAKLIQTASPFAEGEFIELLTAKLEGGKVVALESYVGSAGE